MKEPLLPETLWWMMQLPHDVRPFNLARLHPGIANEICRRWKLTARRELNVGELLIVDHAGRTRQRFWDLASEIAALGRCYAELYLSAKSKLLAWHRAQWGEFKSIATRGNGEAGKGASSAGASRRGWLLPGQ